MNIDKVNWKNLKQRILQLDGQMAMLDMSDNANLSTYAELNKIQLELVDKCLEYEKILATKSAKRWEIGGKVAIFIAFPVLQQVVKRIFENPDHRNVMQDASRISNERF